MNRRTLLKRGAALLGASALGGFTLPANSGLSHAASEQVFTSVLPIPPLLRSTGGGDGIRHFNLSAERGEMPFFPGTTTPTMGYNGSYLGPTIKVRDGEKINIQFTNNLGQRTSLHWHGLHVPARWDGGPRQEVAAGAVWNPEFTVKQCAATLWYHPHAMGLTGEHVYLGLAGLFVVEDEVSDNLDIPKTYGIDDFPIVLQDRRFFNDGRFAYAQSMMDVMHGVIGNYLLVNGSLQPNLDVARSLVRLRILNGSNSSIYRVSFSDNRAFHQIATDGGFQETPVRLDNLILSAGERAEILVDFGGDPGGTQLTLHVEQVVGGSFEAMQFTVLPQRGEPYRVPERLAKIDWIPEEAAAQTRTFSLQTMSRGMGMMRRGGRLTINGRNMDLTFVNEKVKLGTAEIWEIENRSTMMMQLPHSMHLHDVQFQILDRNGRKPEPREAGRKDTVLLLPGDRTRVIARFDDYTGIYMYHCHLLEHEDNGMMGQFEVVG